MLIVTELVTSNTVLNFRCSYCSRGQLGHGSTGSCAEPTILNVLNGLTMVSIATGGWHSATVSGMATFQIILLLVPCGSFTSDNALRSDRKIEIANKRWTLTMGR